VRTWIEEVHDDGVDVHFEIVRKLTGKLSCNGYFHYTMVNTATGRAEKIPDWIIQKYSV
jgi:acyl-CoA thioester hydrolase/thioesterase-3